MGFGFDSTLILLMSYLFCLLRLTRIANAGPLVQQDRLEAIVLAMLDRGNAHT